MRTISQRWLSGTTFVVVIGTRGVSPSPAMVVATDNAVGNDVEVLLLLGTRAADGTFHSTAGFSGQLEITTRGNESVLGRTSSSQRIHVVHRGRETMREDVPSDQHYQTQCTLATTRGFGQ